MFPTTGGAAGGGNLNTSFPLVREVFNVVTYDRVVNTGDGNFDPDLAGLLVGPTSQLCQDAFTIINYGLALLSSKTANTCGQVDTTTLRTYGSTTGF